MNKKLGEDIDKDIHQDLLTSYIKFIEAFSPVLSNVENYLMNVTSENIINPTDMNKNKLETVGKLHSLLVEMVPKFLEIAQIEYELEKYFE